MAKEQAQDINNEQTEQELVKHPTIVEFRKLLYKDRIRRSEESGRTVRSYEQAKEFGFISHVYYNQIENGKKCPSLSTLLVMVEKMGYKITFEPIPEQKSN